MHLEKNIETGFGDGWMDHWARPCHEDKSISCLFKLESLGIWGSVRLISIQISKHKVRISYYNIAISKSIAIMAWFVQSLQIHVNVILKCKQRQKEDFPSSQRRSC